jgi:formate dehydrogenase gamma subunit
MSQAKEYSRFSLSQRLEHWVMVVSFTLLALTGLPQKFAGTGWAETMIGLMGGIEITREIHHAAAILLLLAVIYHFVSILYQVIVLRSRWSIYPQLQDVFDALHTVQYDLGARKDAPKYDHFAWGEKFEYWALVWGTLIMALTGLMMWNPIIVTRFLSGDVIPAAKAAHGAEAILAVLAVVVWHFYNVHLRQFNKSMFTGKLPAHEMETEHALEMERLAGGKAPRIPDPQVLRRRQRVFVPIATVVSLASLFLVFLFTTAETTALQTIHPMPGQLVQVYVPQTPTPLPTAVPTEAPPPTALPITATAVGGTPLPVTPGAATPTALATAAAAKPTPPPAANAPAVPADHAGRTVCTACHATGLAGAPKSPPDHAGRLDAACMDCHKPQ